ncbi:PTS sugar transporter subunit IIC [Thermoanaerobacterium sp. DL9XJH110]|uniref:PTS sugar transporter subunit IIC n=1 Tax=Thermoanaerobacterium sp. DL9XJH110 TaxID=3386643 RepID=UPI003BB65088
MEKNNSLNDKIVSFVMDKLAGPMSKVADNVILNAVRDGLVGATPVIILGSIFLLLAALGQPWIGKGEPLIPSMSPYSDKFLVLFNLTMNILSLYVSIGIAMSYAKHYKLDFLSAALLGVMSFLLITTNIVKDGTISIGPFSAVGLFAAIVVSIFSVWVYRMCIEKNLIIKMPPGVPQGVGNAFSALIPFVIVAGVTWGIRTIIGFDLVAFLSTLMKPIFSAADSIVAFTARVFIGMLLWSTGLHGDNMLAPITQPLLAAWVAENAKALSSGAPVTNLPHIWTTALERMVLWTSSAWGLLFWMYKSKLKHIKALAVACTPAAIFTIIEPLVFGLPVVMNPYFIIPFILSATVAAFVTYGAIALHLASRVFVELPWATPPPIYAYLGTGGDWRAVLLVVINFLIGVVIYYPFFKAFEKSEIEKEQEFNTEK